MGKSEETEAGSFIRGLCIVSVRTQENLNLDIPNKSRKEGTGS